MKFTLIIIGLITLNSALAQDPKPDGGPEIDDCAKYRSLYYEYLKQGMYEDARSFWLQAYQSCGGTQNLDARFFINGKVMYEELEKKGVKQNPQEFRDSIHWIYEEGMKVSDDPNWQLSYAGRLLNDEDQRVSKIDSLFMPIDSLKGSCNPNFIHSYFKHLILNHFNKSEADEKEAGRRLIEQKYFLLSQYLFEAEKQNVDDPENKIKKRIDYSRSFINKYFLKLYGNGELLKVPMGEAFDDLSTEEWLRKKQVENRLQLMDDKGAAKNGVYGDYVKESVMISPSAAGYFGLANMSFENNDYKETIKYLELMYSMDSTANSDQFLLLLANAQLGDKQYSSAFKTAEKIAGDLRGKGMLICAKAIAATAQSCGESSFDRKANYWLANDYVLKAKSLGEDVNSNKYLEYAPTQSDCFKENVKADEIRTCSCWGKTTVVRY